jgi:hypothetical protein
VLARRAIEQLAGIVHVLVAHTKYRDLRRTKSITQGVAVRARRLHRHLDQALPGLQAGQQAYELGRLPRMLETNPQNGIPGRVAQGCHEVALGYVDAHQHPAARLERPCQLLWQDLLDGLSAILNLLLHRG